MIYRISPPSLTTFKGGWVVETPTGELVASALGWLDEENKAGLVEPVAACPNIEVEGSAPP